MMANPRDIESTPIQPKISLGRIFIRSAALFFPFIGIFGGLLFWIYFQQYQVEISRLIEREQAGIDVVERVIKRDFKAAIKDLVKISQNDDTIHAVCDKDSEAQSRVAHYLSSAVELRGIYDQARLIDSNGDEIVRVDFPDNRAKIYAPEELQNKRLRTYFKETRKLQKGEVYISRFDLNVEHGQVERPFKPVIRLATPVFNHNDEKMGIVVLNYHGDNIFNEMTNTERRRLSRFLLVNSEGFYLRGFNDNDTWGFQLKGRAEKRFQVRFPSEWETILKERDGKQFTSEGLLIYHSVQPSKEAAAILTELGFSQTYNVAPIGEKDWILVSFLPSQTLFGQVSTTMKVFRVFLILLFSVFGFLLFTGSFFLAYFRLRQLESLSMARQMALFPEFNPGPTIRLNSQGSVVVANPQSRALFGMNPTGQSWDALREKYIDRDKAIPGDSGVQEEWVIDERTFLMTYRPDEESQDVYIYGLDISERKAFSNQVQENEKRLRAIMELAADAIVTIDDKGEILDFNQTAEKYFGYTSSEIIGRNVSILTPEPFRSNHDEYIKRYLETGQSRIIGHPREVEAIRKDGSIFPGDLSITEVKLEGKRQFTGILRDITGRKKFEQDLLLFRMLLEHSTDSIYIVDPQTSMVLDANRTACDSLGYLAEELKTKPVTDIDTQYTDAKFWQKHVDELKDIGSLTFDGFHRRKNGSLLPVEVSVRYIKLGEYDRILAIARDITDRKRTERMVTRLGRILDGSLNEVFIFDSSTFQFIQVSQGAMQNLGYSLEELQTMTPIDIKPEYSLEQFHLLVEPLFNEKEQLVAFETIHRRKDGTYYPVDIRLQLSRKEDPPVFIAIVQDITERKEAENRLRDSEERYRLAQKASRIGSWEFNLENNSISWSPEAYAIFSVKREEFELTYDSYRSLIHPDDIQLIQERLDTTLETGVEYAVEHRIVCMDGSVRWIYSTGDIFRDDKGEIKKLIGVVMDISERKRSEEALRASEKWFSTTLESIGDAVIGTDVHQRVTYMNQIACDLTGWSMEDAHGKKISEVMDLVNNEDRSFVFSPVKKALQEMKSVNLEENTLLVRKDGQEIPIDDSAAPILVKDGELLGAVMVFRDVTKRKEAEAEMIKAKETAESANRAKSMFLANMSHEIRTPLNAILGFTQLLHRDKDLTQRHRKDVRTIHRSGEHLLNLINDILEMSKIEAGKVTLNLKTFNLHNLIEDLGLMFRPKAEAKGLTFVVEKAENIPLYGIMDEGKLRQIIINLLGNAVKFTETGRITLRVSYENLQEKSDWFRLVIEVDDTGPGISEEERKNLFKSFQQAKAGLKAGGTGLGLAISREFARMMGGDISVRSQVGKGSCFRFEIEMQTGKDIVDEKQHEYRHIAKVTSESGQPRALIVDDHVDNRVLLRALLGPVGFEIDEAANGLEALELWKRTSPDVIFMDMRMPEMDGYEATRKIKGTAAGKNIPIIAVTASALEEDVDQVMEAGVDAYIRKPFREEEIFEALVRLLNIHFIFEKEVSVEISIDPETMVSTPEDLDKLPEELIRSMRESLEEGDMASFSEKIKQAEDIAPEIALFLKKLADQYDYGSLDEILNQKRGQE